MKDFINSNSPITPVKDIEAEPKNDVKEFAAWNLRYIAEHEELRNKLTKEDIDSLIAIEKKLL